MKTVSNLSIIEQLHQEQAKGKEFVVWEVNQIQAEQIKKEFRTEDEIIYIHTRLFTSEEQNKYPLLRQLHQAKKRDFKDYVSRKRLSKKEKKLLDEFGISYCVRKLRIYL